MVSAKSDVRSKKSDGADKHQPSSISHLTFDTASQNKKSVEIEDGVQKLFDWYKQSLS